MSENNHTTRGQMKVAVAFFMLGMAAMFIIQVLDYRNGYNAGYQQAKIDYNLPKYQGDYYHTIPYNFTQINNTNTSKPFTINQNS